MEPTDYPIDLALARDSIENFPNSGMGATYQNYYTLASLHCHRLLYALQFTDGENGP